VCLLGTTLITNGGDIQVVTAVPISQNSLSFDPPPKKMEVTQKTLKPP